MSLTLTTQEWIRSCSKQHSMISTNNKKIVSQSLLIFTKKLNQGLVILNLKKREEIGICPPLALRGTRI